MYEQRQRTRRSDPDVESSHFSAKFRDTPDLNQSVCWRYQQTKQRGMGRTANQPKTEFASAHHAAHFSNNLKTWVTSAH